MAHYENIVEPFETRMRDVLETPDEVRTSLSRCLILAPYYTLDVALRSRMAGNVIDEQHELFLYGPMGPTDNMGPPGNSWETFKTGLLPLFSCFFYPGDTPKILGISSEPPEEKAVTILGTTPLTGEDSLALLALTRQIWQTIPRDGSYCLNDQEYQRAGIPIQEFVTLTNMFVASGTSVRHSSIKRVDPDDGYLVTMSEREVAEGSSPGAEGPIDYPDLYMRIIKEGIEHLYESRRGNVEIRTRIADPYARYANFRSFRKIYDVDGVTPIHWMCDADEIADIEDAERSSGLYEPTTENLRIFYETLENLPPSYPAR